MHMASQYQAKLDIRKDLEEEEASNFHSLINVLMLIVELNCIIICVKVLMLSLHLALP